MPRQGELTKMALSDHFGYQKWHRDLDNTICNWLRVNDKASLNDFIKFMNDIYATDDLVKRFGKVVFGV